MTLADRALGAGRLRLPVTVPLVRGQRPQAQLELAESLVVDLISRLQDAAAHQC